MLKARSKMLENELVLTKIDAEGLKISVF